MYLIVFPSLNICGGSWGNYVWVFTADILFPYESGSTEKSCELLRWKAVGVIIFPYLFIVFFPPSATAMPVKKKKSPIYLRVILLGFCLISVNETITNYKFKDTATILRIY